MTQTRSLDRQGAWLIAGSVLLLTLVAGVAGWREAAEPRRDPVTGCVTGRPVSGEISILLDVTDQLTPEQEHSILAWLRGFELSELRANERVTLWVLGAGGGPGLQRHFCRCYPGRNADPILHNPAMIATVCDSLFSQPLAAAVAATTREKSSRYSLLLGAVREITEQPEMTSGPRRLVLISDLRENTPDLSFYDGVPLFAAFRSSRHFPEVRADLQGVSVDVLYLSRGARDVCTPDLRAFWRSYLTDCGATSVSLRRL